ncbi:hypothetical protein ILUMI_14775, partial [Ignelater luminosus]
MLAEESINDSPLIQLLNGLKTGKTVVNVERFGISQNEFSLQNNIIFRGHRVVILTKLRKQILQELHASHFGIVRMKALARSYCCFGLPQVLVSDNGKQFLSYELKNFLESNGIIHKVSAPYHPATNGLAEKTVQSFKNALRTLRGNNNDRNRDLQTFLFNYRITPHTVTGESPSKLLFGRQIRNRLDLLYPKVTRSTRDTPTRTQLKTCILQEGDRVS